MTIPSLLPLIQKIEIGPGERQSGVLSSRCIHSIDIHMPGNTLIELRRSHSFVFALMESGHNDLQKKITYFGKMHKDCIDRQATKKSREKKIESLLNEILSKNYSSSVPVAAKNPESKMECKEQNSFGVVGRLIFVDRTFEEMFPGCSI